MKTFDFYEFAGVLAPGAVFLFSLTVLLPQLGSAMGRDNMTIGNLGIFVILSYVTGHLVQAAGNVLERAMWKPFGGMPTHWVRKHRQSLLAPAQREALATKLKTKLGLALPEELSKLDQRAWSGITSQIYACVQCAGASNRIDIFNANYGMFRGIAAAIFLTQTALLFLHGINHWKISLVLALALAASLYRMFRFGKHYARELFVQFLQLP
jgi:hypothetical protein